MTHLVPRRTLDASRQTRHVAIAAIVTVAAAAGFVFGYTLWHFLVSVFLLTVLAGLLTLIALLLPSTVGRSRP